MANKFVFEAAFNEYIVIFLGWNYQLWTKWTKWSKQKENSLSA